jgi:hypothetical protein
MARSYYNNYDFLLFFVIFLLIAATYLLYKYDTFREMSIVFFILVIVTVILFRYYEE